MGKLINGNSEKYKSRCASVIKLLTSNPEYISLIKNKYLTDDVLEEAVQLEPELFKYIKNPSLRIVNTALEVDGGNIKYIDKNIIGVLPLETLLNVLDFNFDETISYIVNTGLSEEEKITIFFRNPVSTLENGIDIPEDYIIQAIRNQPNIIRYIPHSTEKMKCVALDSDPNVALYYDTLTDDMMDIIDEKYPYLRDKLPNYTRKHNSEENKDGSSNQK